MVENISNSRKEDNLSGKYRLISNIVNWRFCKCIQKVAFDLIFTVLRVPYIVVSLYIIHSTAQFVYHLISFIDEWKLTNVILKILSALLIHFRP